MWRPDDYQDPRPVRPGLSLFWRQVRLAWQATMAGLYQDPQPNPFYVPLPQRLRAFLQPPQGPFHRRRLSQDDLMGIVYAQTRAARRAREQAQGREPEADER